MNFRFKGISAKFRVPFIANFINLLVYDYSYKYIIYFEYKYTAKDHEEYIVS